MSKVAIQGNASGTGTFTIAAPNSNTDRTLTLPDEAGTVLINGTSDNVGIGTSSPVANTPLTLQGASGYTDTLWLKSFGTNIDSRINIAPTGTGLAQVNNTNGTPIAFQIAGTERMRLSGSGTGGSVFFVGKTAEDASQTGFVAAQGTDAYAFITNGSAAGAYCLGLNRQVSDGDLIVFRQGNAGEGSISVSGSTVSYNGGHLSRWSRLTDDSKDTSIVKGTVMTNLDEMVEWSHETTYWTEDDELPVDEDGNSTVSVGDVKKEAYTEDNEQLNKMAVSSVEGDPNVAGVFVNWDNDDDGFNDMNIAMTGDMVIRVAQGTTVARGDLLMSAGDGTAKPQGDDIVRSKTIAKVTSTHVSHTYDDGSYLVPCVLMAC